MPNDWQRLAELPQFKRLIAEKRRFILPATVFFVVYYFLLPVLVGYFPSLMTRRVGPVNVAYIFAVSQFAMAWILAGLDVRAAGRFDRMAEEIKRAGERR